MQGHHDGQAALAGQSAQDLQKREPPMQVERGGGLVKERDLGLLREGLRGAHGLLPAAAQVAGVAAAKRGEPQELERPAHLGQVGGGGPEALSLHSGEEHRLVDGERLCGLARRALRGGVGQPFVQGS